MPDFTACAQPCIVDNHCFGLIFTNHCIQTVELPIFVRFIPETVKPKPTDFAVIFAENFYAIDKVINVAREILVIIGIIPIEQGMIEERNDAFGITLVHKFAHKIPTAC